MKLLFHIYNNGRRLITKVLLIIDKLLLTIIMSNPKISVGKHLVSIGLPIIRMGNNSQLIIGDNFKINDGKKLNLSGRDRKCILHVRDNARLIIGNNVGMSSAAITATKQIELGNNILIGQNTIIYDTDFHSLVLSERLSQPDPGIKRAPVKIEDNVFIGGHCTILKGVTIGKNSIIGACSVVSKSIPSNQIWAGNPARLVKMLDKYEST